MIKLPLATLFVLACIFVLGASFLLGLDPNVETAGHLFSPGTINWTEFQFSPSRTGFNRFETVLKPSNVGTLRLAWNFGIKAQGDNSFYSSAAVVNGVAYLGGPGGSVYAFDATTGARLWRYTTAGPVESSPAAVDGLVYVGSD